MKPVEIVGFLTLLCGLLLMGFTGGVSYEKSQAPKVPKDLYRVFLLDTTSDEAIARCSRAGGIAGWLSVIEENGDYVGAADIYCAVPVGLDKDEEASR